MSRISKKLYAEPMVSRWAKLNWSTHARWMLTIAFWVFVNLLLWAPAKTFHDFGQIFPFQDKIIHLAIFGIFSALIRWSIPNPWGRGWKAGGIMLILMAYGAGTECVQALILSLGRSFEWADILMDCIGVAVGMLVCGRLSVQVAVPS
jgi:hypothetical protein